MAGTTCLALLFPSSEWEVMWRLNPEALPAFQAMGSWAILLMFSVATACAMAATGLWIRARWGHATCDYYFARQYGQRHGQCHRPW